AWVKGWEQALAEAGVVMEQIYPEVLALPLQTEAWTVLVDGDRFLIRNGKESGLGGDADNLMVLLEAALTEAAEGAPPRLVVYRTAQTPPGLPDSAPAAEHYAVDDSLALLAAHLEPATAIRLGTGAGGAGAATRARWRRWRLPAAIALVLLALTTGHAWLQQWELARRSEQLQARIEATFQHAFPKTPVRSPRMQMENRLAALRGAGDGRFLGLLNAVAPAVAAVEQAQITALSFRAGSLELEVTIDSLQRVQTLEQRLAAAGNLGVEVAGAEAKGKLVRARLVVEAKP
ncbi:MAG: type II secretion system protein GspL, partial [Nitrococcus sp.]|nr:type II secretion system protein GspL [Nitrococcus sp.]